MLHPHSTPLKSPATSSTVQGRFSFDSLKRWLKANRELLSAYPSTVVKIRMDDEVVWPVKALKTNDRICIRTGELVPCDSILATDSAIIDYSFFTNGLRVERKRGELIYAGGRIVGIPAILKVHEAMTRSRFVDLLNQRNRANGATAPEYKNYSVALLLNVLSGFFQRFAPARKSATKQGKPAEIPAVRYEGLLLSEKDKQLILFAVSQSEEPYARAIRSKLEQQVFPGNFSGEATVSPGEGIAIGELLLLGNPGFVGTTPSDDAGTQIWVRIDNVLMGEFLFDRELTTILRG